MRTALPTKKARYLITLFAVMLVLATVHSVGFIAWSVPAKASRDGVPIPHFRAYRQPFGTTVVVIGRGGYAIHQYCNVIRSIDEGGFLALPWAIYRLDDLQWYSSGYEPAGDWDPAIKEYAQDGEWVTEFTSLHGEKIKFSVIR